MDPLRNPFAPGAGAQPPELAGRAALLDQAATALHRILAGRPERGLLLLGLRGVGKTVLLNRIQEIAEKTGFRTVFIEAPEGKDLRGLLTPALRRLLLALDRMKGVGEKARLAWGVLKGFAKSLKVKVGDVEVGLDIEATAGLGDSGDLDVDLTDLFVALGEAAQSRTTGIALFIDELQYVKESELGSLIMALHRVSQKQLPLILFGAGLPQLAGQTGNAKSYAERLFDFPFIGPLSEADGHLALQGPATKEGAAFADEAVAVIMTVTEGYPYFIQEWGYQSWNIATASPITAADARKATEAAEARLDASFFRVRFDRLTPREKDYLFAMAALGPGPHRSGDIAAQFGAAVQAVAPVRGSLMKKGMVYSPTHGETAFTVPLFDRFLDRAKSRRAGG